MGTKIRAKEEIQQKQQIEYYGSNNDNDNDDNNKAGIIRLSLQLLLKNFQNLSTILILQQF